MFQIDPDHEHVIRWPSLHEGKGTVDVKAFFRDPADRSRSPSSPATLLLYTLPPGASEGLHRHQPGDAEHGSFDEFYYVIAGHGEMQVAGERIRVKAGDHVFTPNGVPHGIENTSADTDLKVYVVALAR